MNIPSLSRRRSEPAPTHDGNGDGRIDERDQAAGTAESGERTADAGRGTLAGATAARPVDDDARRTPTGRVAPIDDETRRKPVVTEPATERTVDLDRDRTPTPPVPVDRGATDADVRHDPEVPVVAGPKPRASLLATLGLIASVAGALFVLTGTLAGYGIALGGLGAVLSVLGLIATRRRHVAGKTDALIGILLGLGAVVLGVLAMTGLFDWPTTDGDWVQRFREWLDSQFAGRF